MEKRIWFAMMCIVLASGCSKQPLNTVHASFYHWKTHFQPSEASQRVLGDLEVGRIYVKYFDVDWSEEKGRPLPTANVNWDSRPIARVEIVPTIYITNRTWENLAPADCDTLAELVLGLVKRLHPSDASPFQELQIDADWSRRTRDTYFLFLRHLRNRADLDDVKLSVTLRLHQIKYRDRTGIPPVDRCMVMLYNTGDLDDPKEQNSILTIEDLRAYLERMRPYPLPLDAALPLFKWGVLLRGGRPIKLLNQLEVDELLADPRRQKTGPASVKVTESHYLRGHYLYPEDVLRVESISPAELLACAQYAAQTLRPHPMYISFYHLDESCLASYDPSTLNSFLDAFRQPSAP
jgi:hypothetical protein